MTNHMKRAALAAILGLWALSVAGEAHAVALRCVKIVRDPQVNRETLVNTCAKCVLAKVERKRPGSASDTPSMREYTMVPGARQPLPFMGPGSSRITGELPCPPAR